MTEPKKTGRPSSFTEDKFTEICERLSTGEPLAQICRDEHMPPLMTVYNWMHTERVNENENENDSLSTRFARAREAGFDAIALDAFNIANSPFEGVETTTKADGSVETRRADMLGHRKLQIETRLKLLAKWDPKRYGERMELAGDAKAPLTVQVVRLGDV